MTVDRLGPIDPLQNSSKSGKVERADKVKGSDSINVSSEAQEKGEIYRAVEIAKAAPDLSAERIAELRRKLDDPSYINDAVVSVVADRIIDQFGV